jgi:hypothetical protein
MATAKWFVALSDYLGCGRATGKVCDVGSRRRPSGPRLQDHSMLITPRPEIIDRTVAIQGLAGRDVRLLTCDTSQHTRGRAAGLQVSKVAAKDPGAEPDWSAPDRSGTGVRAQRRARQAEAEAPTAS